jgi:hypothetical protein
MRVLAVASDLGGIMSDTKQDIWQDRHGSIDIADLSVKLEYLVHRRGDQRPLPDDQKIRSLEELSKVLSPNGGNLRRWCRENRLPDATALVPHLCQIFAIERAWLTLSFVEFLEACEGAAVVGWRGLMALAQTMDVGEIEPAAVPVSAQFPNADRLRHALPEDLPDSATGFIAERGSRIQVSLRAPRRDRGTVDWQGWHVVLLSQDPDGYYCLLPRHEERDSMPSARIPPGGVLQLRLKLDPHKDGKHAFVLVALKTPLPPYLEAMLRAPVEGTALEPALDRLAWHALPLVRAGAGVVLRLSYIVR